MFHLQRVTAETTNNNIVSLPALPTASSSASISSSPPQLLITYKQYRPFKNENVIERGGIIKEEGEGDEELELNNSMIINNNNMLSAEEKILELSKIIENVESENEKLNKDLEEV